jgi:glycine cleavage system H protein
MVALLVVLTIVACVVADSIVQWSRAKKEARVPMPAERGLPVYAFEDVSAPAGVFLDNGHTWVRLAPGGTADIGIDRFAQRLIGRIDSVELPKAGEEYRSGDKLFTVRQGERTAAFTAPVDGVVTLANNALARHPDAIQADPYNQGWVCTLSPKRLARGLKQLRIAEDAKDWLEDEVQRFREFFATRPLENLQAGQLLADGGMLTGGILEVMDDDTWRLFAERFLQRREESEEP